MGFACGCEIGGVDFPRTCVAVATEKQNIDQVEPCFRGPVTGLPIGKVLTGLASHDEAAKILVPDAVRIIVPGIERSPGWELTKVDPIGCDRAGEARPGTRSNVIRRSMP